MDRPKEGKLKTKKKGAHPSPLNENRTKIGVIYPHLRSANEDTVANASEVGVVGNC